MRAESRECCVPSDMGERTKCCAWFTKSRDLETKEPLVVREPSKEERQVAQQHFAKNKNNKNNI